jgi:hypothetical protein
MQALNAEKLSYQLELKLEINDDDMKKVEYELGKLEESLYSRAEAMALMST